MSFLTLELHASSNWWAMPPNMHHRSLSPTSYYQAYTSILHTKQLLYYSRHSILTVEHHASFDWWATSLNTHCECFLVRNFVRTSGEHLRYATSLGISLGRKFHIHVWSFRLTACVIRLTMLLQSSTPKRGMHEAPRKKRTWFTARAAVLNRPAIIHYDAWSLPGAQKKWMKLE